MNRTLELNVFAKIIWPLFVPNTMLTMSPFLFVMFVGDRAIVVS